MQTPAPSTQFRDVLPAIPKAPSGFRYEYRGKEWLSERPCNYIYTVEGVEWSELIRDCNSSGEKNAYYAELVPIPAAEEPDYADRDYQKSVLDAAWEGVKCEFFSSANEWRPAYNISSVLHWINEGKKVRIKPQPDPYAELKAAQAAGKVIQCRELSGNWFDLPHPLWNSPVESYRIKPDPEMVPLEAGDAPVWIAYGKTTSDNPQLIGERLVLRVDHCGVVVADESKRSGFNLITWKELMLWDGSPDRKTWSPCQKPASV